MSHSTSEWDTPTSSPPAPPRGPRADRAGARARVVLASASAAVLLAALVGCSPGTTTDAGATPPPSSQVAVDPNAPETNPPGDIPDNQVFVAYSPPGQSFSVSVPEGWARTEAGGTTTFTDKLNSVAIDVRSPSAPPTVQQVTSQDLPAIAAGGSGYAEGSTSEVTRSAGTALLSTYRLDGPPDPVTGKVVNDDVERYVFFRDGTQVVLTLAGPHGADNVDPWRIVTDSFAWS